MTSQFCSSGVYILISSLDKALHSLGYKYGYALPKPQLPNPINIVMVYAQKVMFSMIFVACCIPITA